MSRTILKKTLSTLIFINLIIIACLLLINNISIVNKNGYVIFSFIVNGLIIFISLLKNSKLGFSLREITFLFMFFFMFLSPLIQYLNNDFPWWDTYYLTDYRIFKANIVLMLFMIVYIIVYNLSINRFEENKKEYKEIKNIKRSMDLFFLVTLLCSSYIIINTGFGNLFSRSTNELAIDSSSFSLIISNTFRATSVIYVTINVIYAFKFKKIYKKLPLLIGFVSMLLVNFPTATPRYWTASVYIGLIILMVRKIKDPHLFKIIIIIGILVIFPSINIFRNHTLESVLQTGINIPEPSEFLLAGDFDAFSMLVRAIVYIERFGIEWGNQLVGNVLFFIPRDIWPTKPVGSGLTVASTFGWEFTNVSMPFVGEGAINFGFIGVILFSYILAILTAYGDLAYYKSFSNSKEIKFIELVYPFTLGFLFFILRGDLLSSLSYYIGFIMPVLIFSGMQKQIKI